MKHQIVLLKNNVNNIIFNILNQTYSIKEPIFLIVPYPEYNGKIINEYIKIHPLPAYKYRDRNILFDIFILFVYIFQNKLAY